MVAMLGAPQPLFLSAKPSVILTIGVNGVGKTTTIGKLASRFRADGKKVVIAAGDTFRAAAIEQLDIWAQRSGAEIIKHQSGSDPAAVAFDAVEAAKHRGSDIVIIDTAGRLHTKSTLMDELKKIDRVIKKAIPDAPHEKLLVIDATTGQNALRQAKIFDEAIGLTGIALTKLDGTAKGGIIFAIQKELNIPVKLIGIGEGVEDLRDFDPHDFVAALFES
jgi:fused signal recognition particle receptor